MELEHHQIERRYDLLRVRDPAREARLTASLLEQGQRHPVLVVLDQPPGSRFVLLDGYRRVRALAALGHDTVLAMDLACAPEEALLRSWRLTAGRRFEAIEEAWLLRELIDQHGLSQRLLAPRMGRSVSWICRRLALLDALPPSVVEAVRAGTVGSHSAQKVLVPLARANTEHCERLLAVIVRESLGTRQLAQWWRAWRSADGETRERLVRDPMLYLRTIAALPSSILLPEETPEGNAARRLSSVAGACWKARGDLERLLRTHPELSANEGVQAGAGAVRTAYESLARVMEVLDAG